MTVREDAVRVESPRPQQQENHNGAEKNGFESSSHRVRIVATVAALIAIATAIAIPLLPVTQQQSNISWPQNQSLAPVAAPLVSYAPTELSADIPCAAVTRLAENGGVIASTIPQQSPDMQRYGLVVKTVADSPDREGRVEVVSRDTLVWSAPLTALADDGCSIELRVDQHTASVSGVADPAQLQGADLRPQVTGVFTELAGKAPAGLDLQIEVDSRFSLSPTLIKTIATIACVLATLICLVALHLQDRADGRSSRRVLPAQWWRLRPVDLVVLGVLVGWHFIGANTSDDGYQLGMARASDSSGYIANYFRWFGVPEAPFGTPYYDLLAWMAKVSTVSPWMRLPALAAAILVWWVISREVIPRLGAALRRNKFVVWTAALVLLAFWLPYNNGLRPEPMEALGVLLTWVSVERAIATRRLLPAAIALIIAAVTLTAGPSGLICFAALLAGARQLTRIIVQRARTSGFLPSLLPLAASGLLVLTMVFADQTLATTLEMARVHGLVGPGEPWFAEYLRYRYLLQVDSDGGLTRRFGVFIMVLGLATCLVTMLRRGGRIPGTATGPALRLIGVTLGAIALMMFTPTKWTHHFGVYVGLAAAIAALTATVVDPRVTTRLRNMALFGAAVFFALSLSFGGTNGYWYVSSWGIPWWDEPPAIFGFGLSTLAAGLTVVALAAATWFHIRGPGRSGPAPTHPVARIPVLAVVAAVMVLFEVLSFVKAAVSQYPSYSLAKSNLSAALSGGCGLADDVLVEPDPNASMLRPLAGDLSGSLTSEATVGFTPNGVGADYGSSAPLPYGLDPATTPVMGSHPQEKEQGGPAELISRWYRLPAAGDAENSKLITIAAAGRIRSVDTDGVVRPGQSVHLEYGRSRPDGSVEEAGRVDPIDIGPSPAWRNLRVPMDTRPDRADVVRVVASDKNVAPDQWLAVTPPRVPRTRTLNELVGTQQPVLLDWAVGLNFPCQNPMPTRAGVAQTPNYRVLPGRNGASITSTWQNHEGGGPLGWTQLMLDSRVIPSYLDGDWDRDWGSLEQYAPLDPGTTPAEVDITEVQRSGTWTPGHIDTSY